MLSLFFNNRRLLLLAIALITVTGLSSIHVLPRLEDPTLRQRAAKINTVFPGASAARVESLVTEKLEDELKEIEEIRVIRSASRKELSTITLELHDHVYDVDNVWSRVRDKLNDAQPQLEPGTTQPQFEEMHFKAYALLVALKWDRDEPVNYAILRRQAEELESRLRGLFGTDVVDTFGAPEEEVLVRIDTGKLVALGLTIDEVADSLRSSDAKVSAGGLKSEQSESIVELNSNFESISQIAQTPIKLDDNNRLIRLLDVARVEKDIARPFSTPAIIDGRDSIVLGCLIQPDLRIDVWNRDAEKKLEQFRSELPDGIVMDKLLQQNQFVMTRLITLLVNLLISAAAVTLVIMFMMGWRSAIVVGTALPLAGLMVLGGLRLMEIPLHQMSVTGLIIALGLLIDNAIVVVDETRSRLRQGLSASESIAQAVKHLAVPLFGSTFTTALAFAPLALMPGPAGEFVGSIGISVILAVTSSLFLSLTIIPALLGIFENSELLQRADRWWQSGVGSQRIYEVYRTTLRKLFAVPVIGLAIGIAFPLIGFIQARNLPEQFFPSSDRTQFLINLTMPGQSSSAETRRISEQVRELALEHPSVTRVDWFLGQSAPAFYYNMLPLRSGVPNYGQAFVEIDPHENVVEVIRELQVKLDSQITIGHLHVKQFEQGPPVDAPILIRIFGNDFRELRETGEEVRRMIADVPDVVYSLSDVSNTSTKQLLEVDEDEARRLGLSNTQIARQVESALDGILGGSMLEDTEELPVRIRWNDIKRGDLRELKSLELLTQTGNPQNPVQRVPISVVGQWKTVPNDAIIEHINGHRMNEIQVTVKAGVLASAVLNEFKNRFENSEVQIPAGVKIDFAGESAERNRAVANLMASAGVLMVLMVAGLVLSFQSFRIAGLIGVIASLSVGVGLAALWWWGYSFGFMAIVGIMGLVGVAINDSIVVLAAIRSDEKAREGDPEATSEVVFHSTRHVLSTTLTTIAGFSPLIIRGGGFWPPLAIAIAGGVAGATILALYFAPAAHILLMRKRKKTVRQQEPMKVPQSETTDEVETTVAPDAAASVAGQTS